MESDSGANGPAKNDLLENSTGADGCFADNITGAVQQKLDRPLDKKDLLQAGMVILRKLSSEEISYIYNIGIQDHYAREELWHIREILLAKLSPGDIRTLKEIGAKYGKQLRILDADIRF